MDFGIFYHGTNMSASSFLAWLQPWQIREKILNPKKNKIKNQK
jgi:hypothetical protein